MSFFPKCKNIVIIISSVLTGLLLFSPPALAISANLGITDSHLEPCPQSPNCVVSQNGDAKHSIDPITYNTDRESAKKTLLKVLTVVPRTTVVEQAENYIHALAKSRIFKFVDDVEFYFPNDEKVIHLRSASRLGESDLGVNRRRMEQIRLALKDFNI